MILQNLRMHRTDPAFIFILSLDVVQLDVLIEVHIVGM